MNRDETSTFAAHLQRQLGELVKAYALCDQGCLTQNGVTTAQSYTLLSLPEQGYLTMNGLSEAMALANSTMTRMVDQLVQKGLVRRKPDDEDRRVVLVGLTDQGRDVRRILEQNLQNFFGQVAARIRDDEHPLILHALEQVTQLVRTLALENCCE